MIINSASLVALRTGFTSLYSAALIAAKPKWAEVAMRVTSTRAENQYAWLGSSTSFREWLGDRVIQNLSNYSFTVKNKDFENTVSVRRTDVEDDNVGQYTPIFEMLGYEAAMHPDELVFNLLKSGFSTIGYDGQYFFDTDHPVNDGNGNIVSVSNSGGGSGEPWFLLDVSKPIKPMIYQERKKYEFVALDNPKDENVFKKNEFIYGVDGRGAAAFALWQLAYGSKQSLTADNYGAARASMQSVKGDNGRPLNVNPTLLVVGPSNEKAALEITQAERAANGSTNVYRNTAQVLVVPWLS